VARLASNFLEISNHPGVTVRLLEQLLVVVLPPPLRNLLRSHRDLDASFRLLYVAKAVPAEGGVRGRTVLGVATKALLKANTKHLGTSTEIQLIERLARLVVLAVAVMCHLIFGRREKTAEAPRLRLLVRPVTASTGLVHSGGRVSKYRCGSYGGASDGPFAWEQGCGLSRYGLSSS
jgi:hypothetical protein